MSNLNLKFGPSVPNGAINLAWVTVPDVIPERNTYIANLTDTIPANRTAYTKEVLKNNTSTYTIKLGTSAPITKTGSSVGVFSAPIEVLPPVEDTTGAWHLRIGDGVFRQILTVQPGDKSWLTKAFEPNTRVMALYSVPETRMAPNQQAPDLTITSEMESNAYVVDNHTVALSHHNVTKIYYLAINGVAFPIDDSEVVLDGTTGTLRFINRAVAPTDDVQVGYYYTSTDLVYYGFYDDDGSYHDLDLNPAAGHTYNNGKDSSSLINRVISVFLVPTAAYDYDAASIGSIQIKRAQDYGCYSFVRWSADLTGGVTLIPEPEDKEIDWVPRSTYTVAKYGVHHFTATVPEEEVGGDNFSGREGSIGDIADYPSSVVLARVYVSSTGTADDIKVIDTRKRGGGLTDKAAERELTLSGEQILEAGACWDIGGWDGEPAMLNGTTVIEIPEAILTRRGGKFTEAQVDEIVKKRIPVGILPVVRYTHVTVPGGTLTNVDSTTVTIPRPSAISVNAVSINGTAVDAANWQLQSDTVTIKFLNGTTISTASDVVTATYVY